ncbi:uncharacterized protein CEXT_199931 [Caerostris extrusa]|uniref:Uncharacterized protein n=1 Tax=Caerostris extrusa TaxID=172846 RepID=A0AAV4PTJ7_CAEEX|nr:uncharacterized protein CEXT_199931 [Caerostris extrusa]
MIVAQLEKLFFIGDAFQCVLKITPRCSAIRGVNRSDWANGILAPISVGESDFQAQKSPFPIKNKLLPTLTNPNNESLIFHLRFRFPTLPRHHQGIINHLFPIQENFQLKTQLLQKYFAKTLRQRTRHPNKELALTLTIRPTNQHLAAIRSTSDLNRFYRLDLLVPNIRIIQFPLGVPSPHYPFGTVRFTSSLSTTNMIAFIAFCIAGDCQRPIPIPGPTTTILPTAISPGIPSSTPSLSRSSSAYQSQPQAYQPQPQPQQYQAPQQSYQAPQAQQQPARTFNPAAVHYVNIGKDLAGDYKFGYDTGKGDGQSFREETRLPDGSVQGAYGYVDETGRQRVIKYTAGKNGYQVEGDGIPKAPAAPAPAAAQAQAAPANPGYGGAYGGAPQNYGGSGYH